MTTKRRIVLIVAAVLSFLLLGTAVFLGVYIHTGSSYSVQLTRGQKYLEQGDFENAVLCYQRAVNADPEQADGYIGLAQAYIGLNKYALAEQVVNNGISQTSSARLQLMLQDYFSASSNGMSLEDENGTMYEDGAKLSLNTEMLSAIAQNTYEDYRRMGQLSDEQGDASSYQACVTEWEAHLSFYNTEENSRVIDSNTGKPYSSCRPNQIRVDDLSVLFGGKRTVLFEELRSLQLENVRLEENEEQNWEVQFSYEGCQVVIASDQDGTIVATAANEFVPQAESETEEEDNNLQGKIINAQTGAGVGNATLEFRGAGGQLVIVDVSSSGEYSTLLDPGVYTVKVNCPGFVEETFEVTVNQVNTVQDLAISPLLQEGEIRFVLTWGAQPVDLDSHLNGTTAAGESVAINYSHPRAQNGAGQVLAELDVDDVDGYGPETTTLYVPNGTYEFVVKDFRRTGTMGQQGATVKIYVGNQSPIQVEVSPDVVNEWLVCRIENGEVQVVNSAIG